MDRQLRRGRELIERREKHLGREPGLHHPLRTFARHRSRVAIDRQPVAIVRLDADAADRRALGLQVLDQRNQARGQALGQGMEAPRQGDLHAVGQKSDEDVGLNPLLVLMEDRTDCQVAFEIAEGLFDGNELGVVLP